MSLTLRAALALSVGLGGCAGRPPPPRPIAAPRIDAGPVASRVPIAADAAPAATAGVPDLPPEIATAYAAALAPGDLRLVGLAADGKTAYVGLPAGALASLAGPGQALAAVAAATVVAAIAVPGTTALILVRRGDDGGETLSRWDAGHETALGDGAHAARAPVLSADGAELAFASNQRDPARFDVWLGDGRDPTTAQLGFAGDGDLAPVAFLPDGKSLLVAGRGPDGQHLYRGDLARHTLARLDPLGSDADYEHAVIAAAGKRLYLTSHQGGQFARLYEVDLAGKHPRGLTADLPWDVEGLALAPSGKLLALAVDVDSTSQVYLLDTRSRRLSPSKVPLGVVRDLGFAGGRDLLGFTLATAAAPAAPCTYDPATATLTRWHDVTPPAVVVAPERVQITSGDGIALPGWYYRAARSPAPLVIALHDAPGGQARPGFDPLVQLLAGTLGIAVVAPDLRGAAGSGIAFAALDDGRGRDDAVADLGAVLDWAASRPELDAGKLAVLGRGDGGFLALAGAERFGRRLAAVVELGGASNLVGALEGAADLARPALRAELGDERDATIRQALVERSPLGHVARLVSPLFVIHGVGDRQVPVDQADRLVVALRALHRAPWFLRVDGAGHEVDAGATAVAVQSQIARFLALQLE